MPHESCVSSSAGTLRACCELTSPGLMAPFTHTCAVLPLQVAATPLTQWAATPHTALHLLPPLQHQQQVVVGPWHQLTHQQMTCGLRSLVCCCPPPQALTVLSTASRVGPAARHWAAYQKMVHSVHNPQVGWGTRAGQQLLPHFVVTVLHSATLVSFTSKRS